jgi:hypothetical protein
MSDEDNNDRTPLKHDWDKRTERERAEAGLHSALRLDPHSHAAEALAGITRHLEPADMDLLASLTRAAADDAVKEAALAYRGAKTPAGRED